ncbi:hypothetical protein FWD20_04070 [Candidatus Saccharibacteria bacterium]|nr:hypothetical protein [Candidatus Saccharibacteria bacterium]
MTPPHDDLDSRFAWRKARDDALRDISTGDPDFAEIPNSRSAHITPEIISDFLGYQALLRENRRKAELLAERRAAVRECVFGELLSPEERIGARRVGIIRSKHIAQGVYERLESRFPRDSYDLYLDTTRILIEINRQHSRPPQRPSTSHYADTYYNKLPGGIRRPKPERIFGWNAQVNMRHMQPQRQRLTNALAALLQKKKNEGQDPES